MIEVENVQRKAMLLRFLTKGSEHLPNPPFIAVGILDFDKDPGIVWGKGFSGSLTFGHLRELLQLLVDMNIHTLKTTRMDKHTLPYAKIDADGNHIVDISRLAKRFNIVKHYIP